LRDDLGTAQRKIKKYLQDLAAALRTLPGQQARDIVEELRSHIMDKVGGDMTSAGVDAALAALGRADDLASLYLSDALQAQRLVSRSPMLIRPRWYGWAGQSFMGFLALTGSLCGCFVAAALVGCALLKPIHPLTAGLWRIPDAADPYSFSLRLGFGSVPLGSSDVLGWWIIPLGLLLGLGIFFLTVRLGLSSLRRLRQANPLGPQLN
jgi:hypothetical protein